MRHPSKLCWLLLAIIMVSGCVGATRHSAPEPVPRTHMSVDTGRVAVDGGTLFYEVRGQGPPVILLHPGATFDHRMWEPQVEVLAGDHRVIRYDLRGFGRSSRPTGPFSPVADLYRVLDTLGVERASLVGVGMGSGVALNFALQHPQQVERLVLAGMGMPPAHAPRAPGALDLSAPEGRSRLRELDVPILLIVGAVDSARGLHTIPEAIEREIPGVHRVIIPGAGELANMERPEAFNQALLAFLAR